MNNNFEGLKPRDEVLVTSRHPYEPKHQMWWVAKVCKKYFVAEYPNGSCKKFNLKSGVEIPRPQYMAMAYRAQAFDSAEEREEMRKVCNAERIIDQLKSFMFDTLTHEMALEIGKIIGRKNLMRGYLMRGSVERLEEEGK